MSGKFRKVPSEMFGMFNRIGQGHTPMRVINRLIRQEADSKKAVGVQIRLSSRTNERLSKVTQQLGTTKRAVLQGLVHLTLPEMEKLVPKRAKTEATTGCGCCCHDVAKASKTIKTAAGKYEPTWGGC